MTENGSDHLPFEPPEHEAVRLREEKARPQRILAVHSIPIPRLPAESASNHDRGAEVDKEQRGFSTSRDQSYGIADYVWKALRILSLVLRHADRRRLPN
jgi:hypothetical protein